MKNVALIIVIILAVLLGLGFVWLDKPYLSYSWERVSDLPETVSTQYLISTGDPLCTNLYIVENNDNFVAVYPKMPDDLPDPHSDIRIQHGDPVILTGFRSNWIQRNKITGKEIRRNISVIDVIEWRSTHTGELKTQKTDFDPANFNGANYTSCR